MSVAPELVGVLTRVLWKVVQIYPRLFGNGASNLWMFGQQEHLSLRLVLGPDTSLTLKDQHRDIGEDDCNIPYKHLACSGLCHTCCFTCHGSLSCLTSTSAITEEGPLSPSSADLSTKPRSGSLAPLPQMRFISEARRFDLGRSEERRVGKECR